MGAISTLLQSGSNNMSVLDSSTLVPIHICGHPTTYRSPVSSGGAERDPCVHVTDCILKAPTYVKYFFCGERDV